MKKTSNGFWITLQDSWKISENIFIPFKKTLRKANLMELNYYLLQMRRTTIIVKLELNVRNTSKKFRKKHIN